jgi:hypothetical protein
VTERMREALLEARKGPLRRVHDGTEGKPPWPAPAASLAALVKHGLLARSERKSKNGNRVQEWTLTDAGREALKPPPAKVVQARPVFLAARPQHIKADYTTDPSRALLGAGEVLDPPSVGWEREAVVRHAEVRDRRDAARRVRRAA